MRIDITPYSVLAFLLVVAGAALVAVIAELARRWCARLWRIDPRLAGPGLAAAAASVVNLAVPRSCGPGGATLNRPVLSLATNDACASGALLQAALVPVVVAGVTMLVLLSDRRAVRSGTAG